MTDWEEYASEEQEKPCISTRELTDEDRAMIDELFKPSQIRDASKGQK